jgi:glycosyltransferase involved in cell wall biosynthesis
MQGPNLEEWKTNQRHDRAPVASPTARRLRILARPARSSWKDNPYTSLLYDEVQKAGLDVVEYRPHLAPLGRWDVLHVHWPESVFDHTLVEAIPTTESLLFGIRRARANGAKVLWTIHNLHTHEQRHRYFEERFWRRFIPELDGVVALTEAGLRAAIARFPGLAGKRAFIVPHPHYRGQYADELDRAAARRRLGLGSSTKVMLVFGRMYEYKNVPALLRAVRAAPAEDWAVLVAGAPRTAEVARSLRDEGLGDPRVRYHLEFIDPPDAQVYFRAADIVVQPYREILNSGTALLALSFDRPVLLPRHGAGADLATQFGPPWVHSYEGELGPDDLRRALATAATLPERTDGTHLRSLDITEIGRSMVRAYREVLAS